MNARISMQLHIESVVGAGADAERMTYDTPGKLNVASGNYTLSFTDEREGCKIFTTLTYRPHSHRVHMKARGSVKYELIFDIKEECSTVYEVPPCKLNLTVRSREVSVGLDEFGGEIHLLYTREVGGDTSDVTYTLTATPIEEEEL